MGDKKIYINVIAIIITLALFFIFKDNLKVKENVKVDKTDVVKVQEVSNLDNSITGIIVKKEIKLEKFTKIYTGSVLEKNTFDLDIDLNNIVYSGTTVDVYFSTNPDFISYSAGSEDNKIKVKMGYMLGKARNKDQLFWVGRVVDSLKTFHHSLEEVNEDGELSFRAANIEGGKLYIKILLNGLKKVIK